MLEVKKKLVLMHTESVDSALSFLNKVSLFKKKKKEGCAGRAFIPSLAGEKYLNLGSSSKSDHRAEFSMNIVRHHDDLVPRVEAVRSFPPFYANNALWALSYLTREQ